MLTRLMKSIGISFLCYYIAGSAIALLFSVFYLGIIHLLLIPFTLAATINAAFVCWLCLRKPQSNWHGNKILHAFVGGVIGLFTYIVMIYVFELFPAPLPWEFVSWEAFWKFQPVFFGWIFGGPGGIPFVLIGAVSSVVANPWAVRSWQPNPAFERDAPKAARPSI